jgi:hypothetical protein
LRASEARGDEDDREEGGESKAGGDLHANQFEDPRALSGWPVRIFARLEQYEIGNVLALYLVFPGSSAIVRQHFESVV